MDILKKIKELYYDWNINLSHEWDHLEICIRLIKVCNEKCVFCSTDLDNKYIDFEELKLIIIFFIKAYSNKYKLSFVFSWGEPTLYPQLFEISSFVINKGFSLEIQTNAVRFSNPDFLNKFLELQWKMSFFISLHWHDYDLYKKITNSSLFHEAIQWIRNIIINFWNNNVKLNFVLNTLNYQHLKLYIDFLNLNFYYDWEIQLVISNVLANKQWYDFFLVNYKDVISYINMIDNKEILKNVTINHDVWWYCNPPFCIMSKIKNIDIELMNSVPVDINVGSNIMHKWKKCILCKYNNSCIGISKKYYLKFWDEDLIPII